MLYGHKRHTLFRSTATTVAAALIVFQLIMPATTAYYIMLPMAKRSADDLAAIMVLSAQTWVEFPPQTRMDFELELAKTHNLRLFDATADQPGHDHRFPLPVAAGRCSCRTDRGKHPDQGHGVGTDLVWAEIRTGGKLIRIGFPATARHAATAGAVAGVGSDHCADPAYRRHPGTAHHPPAGTAFGSGETCRTRQHPGSSAGKRPEELAKPGARLQPMALQVQELLANRTTLLRVSPTTCAPLARMRLAVEMLPGDAAPKLVARLQHDLEEMNRLIGEFIELSHGLEKETAGNRISPSCRRSWRTMPQMAGRRSNVAPQCPAYARSAPHGAAAHSDQSARQRGALWRGQPVTIELTRRRSLPGFMCSTAGQAFRPIR